MNCVELFTQQAKAFPEKTAIWISPQEQVSFRELVELSGSAQNYFKSHGLQEKDCVLLLEPLSPHLYALICGALASGISIILVEPWMPLKDINHVINIVQPKMFITRWWGYIWGARLNSVRDIPHWTSAEKVLSKRNKLEVLNVDPATAGIITFTTGTTGKPKGVLRSQGYLIEQFKELDLALGLSKNTHPDLTVFANFALANLAAGKSSVIVHPAWKPKQLEMISSLPQNLQPRTSTMGPGFLKKLLGIPDFLKNLEDLHVGGALTDTWIFEETFRKWPEAHVLHLYGSSEAEPVALCDARQAVQFSKEKDLFQTLFVGKPSPNIHLQNLENNLWVSGNHVCPEYIGAAEDNKKHKRRDQQGILWHDMGDRITENENGLWYAGRSSQDLEDFQKEQAIYSQIQSSANFLFRNPQQELCIIGKNLQGHRSLLMKNYEISHVYDFPILRDRRHRARIDRAGTLKKSGVLK